MFSDALICFQMFSNVFRIFSIANSRSLDFFRCVQDVFRCSQMFKDVSRCSEISSSLDVHRMFSRCSHDIFRILWFFCGLVGLMGLISLFRMLSGAPRFSIDILRGVFLLLQSTST